MQLDTCGKSQLSKSLFLELRKHRLDILVITSQDEALKHLNYYSEIQRINILCTKAISGCSSYVGR